MNPVAEYKDRMKLAYNAQVADILEDLAICGSLYPKHYAAVLEAAWRLKNQESIDLANKAKAAECFPLRLEQTGLNETIRDLVAKLPDPPAPKVDVVEECAKATNHSWPDHPEATRRALRRYLELRGLPQDPELEEK